MTPRKLAIAGCVLLDADKAAGQHKRPDPDHVFDVVRAELAGLDSSDLTASLGQRELGDCAILDGFRAPVATCKSEGHDIAFRLREKSLAEFARGRRNDEAVARDQIKELMEGREIGFDRRKDIDVVMRERREQAHAQGDSAETSTRLSVLEDGYSSPSSRKNCPAPALDARAGDKGTAPIIHEGSSPALARQWAIIATLVVLPKDPATTMFSCPRERSASTSAKDRIFGPPGLAARAKASATSSFSLGTNRAFLPMTIRSESSGIFSAA